MNRLPSGFMQCLQAHCKVDTSLAPGHNMTDGTALYFLFQGAIATVDRLKVKEGTHILANMNIKGFHGRGGGQRLRKRYPPGSVVNQTSFILSRYEHLLDRELQADMVISSKFGLCSEVWSLPAAAWASLPMDMQNTIDKMVMMHQSEQRQHTLLSGE